MEASSKLTAQDLINAAKSMDKHTVEKPIIIYYTDEEKELWYEVYGDSVEYHKPKQLSSEEEWNWVGKTISLKENK